MNSNTKKLDILAGLLRSGKITQDMYNQNQANLVGAAKTVPDAIDQSGGFRKDFNSPELKRASTLSNVSDAIADKGGFRQRLSGLGKLAVGPVAAFSAVSPALGDLKEGNINQAVNKLTVDSLPGSSPELEQLKQHFKDKAEMEDMTPEQKAKREYLQALKTGRAG